MPRRLWEFALLGLLVLGAIGWIAPWPRLELLAYKCAMALVLGPAIGMLVHYFCVPADHFERILRRRDITDYERDIQLDGMRWRRVACIAAATLTVGLSL